MHIMCRRSNGKTDYFSRAAKKVNPSKTEQIAENFRELVGEDGGFEKSVVSSYVDAVRICLDQLFVSPDMFKKLNQWLTRQGGCYLHYSVLFNKKWYCIFLIFTQGKLNA